MVRSEYATGLISSFVIFFSKRFTALRNAALVRVFEFLAPFPPLNMFKAVSPYREFPNEPSTSTHTIIVSFLAK